MKLLKQITAVMAALLIVVNLSFINTSAAMAAPVIAGEELAGMLAGALAGAGYSQSEIDGMSIDEMKTAFNDGVKNGTINIDMKVPVNDSIIDFYGFLMTENRDLGLRIIANAVNDLIGNGVSDDDIYNYFTPTSTTDYMGRGATMYIYDKLLQGNGSYRDYYKIQACDYIVIEPYNGNGVEQYKLHFYGYIDCYSSVDAYGRPVDLHLTGTSSKNYSFLVCDYENGKFTHGSKEFEYRLLYGDVRTMDGEPFPTDDEYQYQLGALPDGTVVTPDMLNPDGTVTVDGVTYDPVDYLDPDNLTDEGKKSLIDAIADAISNTYVVADDKPIVDADDITIEVAEELQDYAVPVGIANVFPFCIPWDIVRGFQLLNRPAVTPKFEIPFNIPEFGLFPGVDNSITLDFSKYDTYIQIFRWFQLIGFSFLLCKLSLTRVKGAGA